MWLHPADSLTFFGKYSLLRELSGRVSADGARHRVGFYHCTVECVSRNSFSNNFLKINLFI